LHAHWLKVSEVRIMDELHAINAQLRGIAHMTQTANKEGGREACGDQSRQHAADISQQVAEALRPLLASVADTRAEEREERAQHAAQIAEALRQHSAKVAEAIEPALSALRACPLADEPRQQGSAGLQAPDTADANLAATEEAPETAADHPPDAAQGMQAASRWTAPQQSVEAISGALSSRRDDRSEEGSENMGKETERGVARESAWHSSWMQRGGVTGASHRLRAILAPELEAARRRKRSEEKERVREGGVRRSPRAGEWTWLASGPPALTHAWVHTSGEPSRPLHGKRSASSARVACTSAADDTERETQRGGFTSACESCGSPMKVDWLFCPRCRAAPGNASPLTPDRLDKTKIIVR